MSFIGATVTWQAFNPNTRSPLITELTETVRDDFVEFENISNFEVNGELAVNADIDFTSFQIRYTIDETNFVRFASSSFNGYRVQISDGPVISDVFLDSDTTLGLRPNDIFFNGESIFVNVESLGFRNGDSFVLNVRFDPAGDPNLSSSALTTGRLYEAGFGREADNAGLNFWYDQHQDGLTFEQMAGYFLKSTEFARLFGEPENLSDRQLVERLYENILDRAGETSGVDFWTSSLEGGLSREAVLVYFAESPENVAGTTYLDNLSVDLNGDLVIV
ncbi:MAG: DUF4214 domain-containing protein [Pseudomonadota bacterium]|nr:DUF4214 domain-containing protein [Pseudomonadota bacterium]